MNYQKISYEVKRQILEELDLSRELSDEEIKDCIDRVIFLTGKKYYIEIGQKKQLKTEIFNSIRRLDILQELIEDQSITEIMINGFEHIFIEKAGHLIRLERQFESKEKLEDIIQQIVANCNRMVNESNPIVDARLEDGSRVNVVLPPVALNGPIVTIRKFPHYPITMETLISIGSITEESAEFLKKLVIAKYNIFICGGTGSGKTTFLNALSDYIPKEERIITIEDSAELQLLNIPNLVSLEARNQNVEGKNEITIRDLIKTALRMRPSRIILGEVRDGACVDLITGTYGSGHDGSMSTGHGNSNKEMLSRLETLYLMGMEIPVLSIRRQIGSALDIMVHLGRLRDKSRKVLEIAEVIYEKEEILLQPLYKFKEEGEENRKIIGELKRTKHTLLATEKLLLAGYTKEEVIEESGL